ncbi:MAG TPA: redoxin domain-containing protein [Candidatus Acidoferrales bacterium]|nr:redoxin domain-containing protein [Candidatus Acidoferrales bacterium]
MKCAPIGIALISLLLPLVAQQKPAQGPANEKAQKTYEQALKYVQERMPGAALDSFKKADKQDGGHCLACQKKIVQYATQFGDWKAAEAAAQEMVTEAQSQPDLALAHYEFGMLLLNEGLDRRKDEFFNRSHDEFGKALAVAPKFPAALFEDGRALAHLKQDDAAKTRFQQFVEMKKEDSPERQRAQLFITEPDLARALMAPPFSITTLDGQHVSLDDLQGKVVLIDFWATWCGPCREALPHMREIAKKFAGQPLVVVSISLDTDETKWKEFVAKNEMTWLQYCDHGFTGSIAQSFGVKAIPHTFTIDADGILQDEHIGDASIEGKLKKLIKRAQEKQAAQKPSTTGE